MAAAAGDLRHEGRLERLEQGLDELPPELEPDITLLLGRGYLVRQGGGHRWADEPTAQRVLRELRPLPPDRPTDLSARWAAALTGDERHDALLIEVAADPPPEAPHPPPAWIATPEDLEIGFGLVPLVLGMRASGVTELPDRPVGRAVSRRTTPTWPRCRGSGATGAAACPRRDRRRAGA